MKKTYQREVIKKLGNGEQSFLYVTHHFNLIHIAIKFLSYSIWLPTYGMYKVSLKFHQRKVTQKLRKGEHSFLQATHRLNLIHIAIKFHQDIPYGY